MARIIPLTINRPMRPPAPIVSEIKSVITSTSKKLWIFGAGASLHLGFPLSRNFFAESILLVTKRFKTYANDRSIDYLFFNDAIKRHGVVPTISQIRAFTSDPALALQFRYTWEYLKPDGSNFIPIQELFQNWLKLPGELANLGLTANFNSILNALPETLINTVRNVNSAPLMGRFRTLANVDRAKEETVRTLQKIYFYTLSIFNEQARARKNSLYLALIRSFHLEKSSRIISFNYDTVLDEGLAYAFTKTWEYEGVKIFGVNGHPFNQGRKSDLPYIKPHGSLNLLRCEACGRFQIYWNWTYRRTGVNSAASENRRCVYCKSPRPGRAELLGSGAVPPLYDKKVIEETRRSMVESIARSRAIFAVGYSFPDQDNHFWNCLDKGLGRNKFRSVKLYLIGRDLLDATALRDRIVVHLPRFQEKLRVTSTPFHGFEGFMRNIGLA